MSRDMDADRIRYELISVCVRRVASERSGEDSPYYAANLEYIDDQIDDLAKRLSRLVSGD